MVKKLSEKESILKKFKILSDEPLFKKGYQAEVDAFHHEAYANTIYKLLLSNKPPLSIGLFGSWGIGKSTVINILLDKTKKEQSHNNIVPVYFNAWKYSGDSFRRQFLLTVAEKILLNKEKEVEIDHIKNLFHKEILKEVQKTIIESLKERFTHFKKEPLRFLRLVLSSIGIALLVFALIELRIPAPLIAIITGFLLYLLTKTIPDILQVNIPLETDPQLVLPEQFEGKFEDILSPRKHKHLKDNNILIVIDDFDRCHPEMISDIFTSIKTFLKHERCFFLVALDDKSVVEILGKENPRYGYEELRKYFDATIRMSPLGKSDLVDFANTVARKTGIPESVIQIAILSEYNDARKMKYFINTFTAKYRIAKEREVAGFIPFDIDDQLDALAKMVVIETQYPQVFDKITKEPQFLKKLEKQALGGNPGEGDIEKCLKSYPGLKEFLVATRGVEIEHIELFSTLKTSSIQARLPRGFELTDAILHDRKDITKEILKEIHTDEKKTMLVDLVIDMLNRATAIFLRNITTFALDVINLEDYLTGTNRSKLSQAVCKNFFRPGAGQTIVTQNINYLFKCANVAGDGWLKELAQNSIEEISAKENISNEIDSIINNLYEFNLLIGQPKWITTINKKMDEWYDKAVKEKKEIGYFETLDKLYVPKEEEVGKGEPVIPSIKILEKIAKSISTDGDETTIKLNESKRKIIFDRWNNTLTEAVSERIKMILTEYSNETNFSGPVKFAIEAVNDIPDWLSEKDADQIATHAQNFCVQCSESPGKMEALKAILTATTSIKDPTVQNNSIDFFLQQSTEFDESEIEEFDKFIAQYKDNEIWQDIKGKFVLHQWEIVKSQINVPNELTRQRFIYCFKNKKIIDVSQIGDFLNSLLDDPNENSLSFWEDTIIGYAKRVDSKLPEQILTKCVSGIKNPQVTDVRRGVQYQILLGLLSQIPKHKRTPHIEELIVLLNDPNPPIRNGTATHLSEIEKLSLKRDFKITLNNVTRNLCDRGPSDIFNYKLSLDAALEYPHLWGRAEWEDLAGLIKRMLDLNINENVRKYARELIWKLPMVPKEYASDLTHQLIVLTNNSPIDEEKQDCSKILSEMRDKGLDKEVIEGFFKE